MTQDARKFMFASDYQAPVVVYSNNGSISTEPYGIVSKTIKHNLGFVPLLMGQWSSSSNFQPCQDIANEIDWRYVYYESDTVLSCTFETDGTNIYIEAQNMSDSAKTFYWRIFAYAPPGYDGETPIVTDTTRYIFNSESNYPKIVLQGLTDTVQYGSTVSIPHGLGYIPQARIWQQTNGKVSPCFGLYSRNISGSSGGPRLTSSDLIIKNLDFNTSPSDPGQPRKYYYHIYGDES